jgi:3-oxoacyl-[acyl-carrier protein] reductase
MPDRSATPPALIAGPGRRVAAWATRWRRVRHDDRVTGRAVLVTGASRGIGRAIAMAFAEGGDRVAVHHRDSAPLADQLRDSLPGDGHLVVRADLADPEAVRAAVDGAAERLGGLDVLVNNAGRYAAHPILETSYEQWQLQWRRVLDANLVGAANAIWCAVRHMRERGGRIVNVSSRGAFRGEPDGPAYGASKAGLNSLGQSLAVALAPYGIAVATVAPGFVETDMSNEHLKSARGTEIRSQSPFNRVARPEEIAAAVHWLASPEAEWASGTIVDLNGASYLRS